MPKKTITITLDEETYKAIKKKAAFEKRSFSSQVDWILSDFVEKNKAHKNRPTKEEYKKRQEKENQQEQKQEPKEKITLKKAVEQYKMVLDQGINYTPKQAFESYEFWNEINFTFEEFKAALENNNGKN